MPHPHPSDGPALEMVCSSRMLEALLKSYMFMILGVSVPSTGVISDGFEAFLLFWIRSTNVWAWSFFHLSESP